VRNKAATRASDGRFIWRFLLLMPVLTWFALVVFSMVTCPRLPKTGDALLDKLVSTLNDGLVQGYLHVTPYFISLPDDVLAGWEPEFGDDPRYWMLRYQLTEEVPAEYQSIHADLDVRPQVYYLEEARRRGIADGPLLYKLLSEYPHLWFEQSTWWGPFLHSCHYDPYERYALDISAETERR